MSEERRKQLRRQADQNLWNYYQQTQAQAQAQAQTQAAQGASYEDSKEARRLRRRANPHNCEVYMALKLSHSGGTGDVWTDVDHPVKGRILDLSIDGCSVFSGQPIEIGQTLSLKLGLRNGKRIQTQGVVRWTKGVDKKDGFASGVQFAKLSSKELKVLQSFLKEMDDTVGL